MDETRDLDFSLMPNSNISYRSPPPGALLAITEAGRQTVRSLIDGRILPTFAAVLVENGKGTLETAPSGLLPCEAPALFWLVPGLRHTYGPLPGTAWDERWVIFEGTLAENYLAARLIDPVAPAIALPPNSDVPNLFRELHLELRLSSALGDRAAAATLSRMVTRAAIEAEQRAPRRPRDIDMVKALRDRAFATIDLEAFADEFEISPATLRRRFIALTGQPPKVVQLRARIDRAKELLATTDRSIEQIAGEIGFDDSFYFARLFLQRESLTPSEFRRRNHRH